MSDFKEIKMEFLKYCEKENRGNVIDSYLQIYNNIIQPLEIEKDKDLFEFTKEELFKITGKKRKTKFNNRTMTEGFVFGYIEWRKDYNRQQKILEKQKKIERIKKAKEDAERRKIENELAMKKYLEQKEVFFKEFHKNIQDSSMQTYKNCYITNIAPLEIYKNKDLYKFNDDDVIEIFESMSTVSVSVKRIARNFINAYFIWADSKGLIVTHTNPLDSYTEEELFELNMNAFRKQFLSLDETYALCEKAIKNNCSYQDCMIVLLARYGVEGKELINMSNLKWSDIDRDLLKLKIVNDEDGVYQEFDIDDRFLQWLDKAKECTSLETVKIVNKENTEEEITYTKKVPYYDYGFVLKSNYDNKKDGRVKSAKIYARLRKLTANVGLNQLIIKNLVISREFDLINRIKDIKGEIIPRDVAYVHNIFYPNASVASYCGISEKYELFYGVKINTAKPKSSVAYELALTEELAMAEYEDSKIAEDNNLES